MQVLCKDTSQNFKAPLFSAKAERNPKSELSCSPEDELNMFLSVYIIGKKSGPF